MPIMSFDDCLRKAAIHKLVNEGKADEAIGLYEELVADYEKSGISSDMAREMAGREATEVMTAEKALKKKRTLRSAQVKNRLEGELKAYRNTQGEVDYASAALSFLEYDGVAAHSSVMARKQRIEGMLHAGLADAIQKYQPKVVGLHNPKSGMDNLVREIFGENTGDQGAKHLAKAASDTFETARKMANRMGAGIGKREKWGLPQTHNRIAVAKVGKEKWVNDVMPRLDWDKMVHPETGRKIPEELRVQTLSNVYDTIKTNGYVKLKPGNSGRSSLANKMSQHRFLEFKSADDWLAYQKDYGEGSAFDVMINHVDSMSQDIAMMEIFGPNPHNTVEWLKSMARKQAGEVDAANKGASKSTLKSQSVDKRLGTFDEMYANMTNRNGIMDGDRWGHTFAGIRNSITSAFLGSASLLAIPTDMFTSRITGKFNGLDSSKYLKRYLRMMNPLDSTDRQLALRSGLIAEAATSTAFGQQRFFGQLTGPHWTKILSDFTMRASLMTPHTQSMRWAVKMEYMGVFADNAGKKFNDLHGSVKKTLSNHGITPEEWDVIRKTNQYDHKGAKFLRPDDIYVRSDIQPEKAKIISDKYMELIIKETDYAVPTSSLRARSFLISDSKPGTIGGEILRSGAMFKNFPVTIMFTHMRRGLMQEGVADKAKYLAAFGIGMTTMGALGLQMRQVTQGKDPMSMNPATSEGRQFWAKSAMTGGGLAIWGDFLFQDLNRYGSSKAETAAGPVVQAVGKGLNLTVGNAVEIAQGKDPKVGKDMVDFASTYAPGSSIFYLRLAMKRLIWDQLLLMTDPKAHKKMRQMEKRTYKNSGQKYWWKPGQTSPSRAPNFATTVD